MHYLQKLNEIVWGLPTIFLILGVGIYLSVRCKFPQFTLLPMAIKDFVRKCRPDRKCKGGQSSYRALCTALAATVGTGNIAGVAGAITIGGPGAVFWMWMCALLGMTIKFAEATLAVRYRVIDGQGAYMGGPMYIIRKGLSKRWHFLGSVYCFFGIIAALGVGNATQVNAVIGGIQSAVITMGYTMDRYWNWLIGIVLCVLVASVLLGGAEKIGAVAEGLIPFASVFYILLALWVIIRCYENIADAFALIIQGAFTPKAATGGLIGSVFMTLRTGAARGVFTNEAGMGTASIAHAGADVEHPCQQGLMGIMEVFIDTIVICTLTALVILTSGIDIPYSFEYGPGVTLNAFIHVCGEWVSIPLAICLSAFAIATIFGWGLYGLRCAQYLFGNHIWKAFACLQSVAVILGAIMSTGAVWVLAELINGLMAIPNLIALIALTPEVSQLTRSFQSGHKIKPTA